jgi:N6-L-threonylcarbamoyladenine synthase
MNNNQKPIITLGIETSCDETGAAIYHSQQGLLSNALFSQVELHRKFGGVMPEVASRNQLEKINPIVHAALTMANISLEQIDVVAVTNKPGLPGSLLVGVCFAKALAWAGNKKLIGVNHLEGHAFSAFLEHAIPFPHICITASGGHTSIYLVKDFGDYEILGQTVDDAAGEAFDKIAKLIGLPYPGGPEIEKRARAAEFQDFFSYPRHKAKILDFSFSGLKTAVLYDLVKRGAYDMATKTLLDDSQELKDKVASSLLVCIADIFKEKVERAIKLYPQIRAVSFVGGVACNKYIRAQLQELCGRYNLSLYTPAPQFCTDNAAMIAFVGNYKALRGEFSDNTLDILK